MSEDPEVERDLTDKLKLLSEMMRSESAPDEVWMRLSADPVRRREQLQECVRRGWLTEAQAKEYMGQEYDILTWSTR